MRSWISGYDINHLDLFSGIGGFSLGLEKAGFKTIAFCEIESYPQQILKQHWPNVQIYEDVTDLTDERLRADGFTNIRIITGGFPCQDLSVAGKQKGITAERSGLFFEVIRIISEVQPKYVILENVRNLLSGEKGAWFGTVLHELAKIGYDCEWNCIPASSIGAPHQRDRVWIVAYRQTDVTDTISTRGGRDKAGTSNRQSETERESVFKENGQTRADNIEQVCEVIPEGKHSNTLLQSLERQRTIASGIKSQLENTGYPCWWKAEPDVGRVVDGIPKRVDRIKGLGNAIVPQIASIIGKAINERHN